jgi:malate synthase
MDGDDSSRVGWVAVPGADLVLTPDFVAWFVGLHDRFAERVIDLRAQRGATLDAALSHAAAPGPLPPSQATTEPWSIGELPAALWQRGVEISGPAAATPMLINALNPGLNGQRAVGDLDDDEDSGGHCLADTVQAARNRVAALEGTLAHDDRARGRAYRLEPGPLPFFMHRERGWHLDEPDLRIDGRPVSATLLGTALTLFHAGRSHTARGEPIQFYLPKCESVDEVRLYRDLFDHARASVQHLRNADILGIVLIESLPAVWQMEEMLHALGPYSAGLNAARWDLQASLLEFSMTDAGAVWPDRFAIDVKTTPFLADIFRRLVAVCRRHGAVPIGGMATALPHRDPAVNEAAAAAIRSDKEWEAKEGFVRGWVAHIHHMQAAAEPFQAIATDPRTVERAGDRLPPVRIETPAGVVTEEGTRRNVRTLIEYVEGWLQGRGAKGIDSLETRPGARPALMEDLATARISVAQTAQRVRHGARCSDTDRRHDVALVRTIAKTELHDILGRRATETHDRYEAAATIALQWLHRYLELDFASLGSFTRTELLADADRADAL